jgi:4-amino-4-deoxy-L-arabinose transferase-like glycosyltransferase
MKPSRISRMIKSGVHIKFGIVNFLRVFSGKSIELTIISLVYLLINAPLFFIHGIKEVNDTHRYIEYANRLSEGFYFDPHNFWYIGYTIYIWLIHLFHNSSIAIVVGQYLIGFLASISLYKTSFIIWQNKRSALITVLLYLLFIDISSWNSYVLAESIFVSFICFSMHCLVLVYSGKRNFWFILLTGIVVLFTVLIKPTGIALLGALLTVLIYKPLSEIKNKPAYTGTMIFIVCVFLLLVNRMLATYLVMENYQLGEIIYAVSTVSGQYDVTSLMVATPDNIYQPPADYPPLFKIISFFFHHPIYWLELFLSKAYYLLLHVRPFWSKGHNLFSLFVLIPSYFFFLKAIIQEKTNTQVVTFVKTYLFIHLLSVCITSDDWDGRFLIPMLPVIFLFEGRGLRSIAAFNGLAEKSFV